MYVAVALLGALLDQLTKIIAINTLDPGRPVQVLGELLRLRLIRNPGAAFGLGEGFTPLFSILSAAVLIVIVVVFVRRIGHPAWAVALGLVSAGVIGNLFDRLFRPPGFLHGHVVDFLQLPNWPIFNLADMCITSAAVLIIVLSVIKNIGLDGQRLAPNPRVSKAATTDPVPTPSDESETTR